MTSGRSLQAAVVSGAERQGDGASQVFATQECSAIFSIATRNARKPAGLLQTCRRGPLWAEMHLQTLRFTFAVCSEACRHPSFRRFFPATPGSSADGGTSRSNTTCRPSSIMSSLQPISVPVSHR
ncbi:hypothetical protein SJ05684_b42140 (plasmid) [Sinorhizobium sojae CCBAU 05684]|uniref:Uncharacterized protein n=1 Tax=Sinorhizobium sojae CCBAU 05684 TaxID=716928 RepID=A0A249PHC6_9HYPH|nr:hypothetical protein SJ05684_b42140 [Sinorhizobium sojae CCBAU 05684]